MLLGDHTLPPTKDPKAKSGNEPSGWVGKLQYFLERVGGQHPLLPVVGDIPGTELWLLSTPDSDVPSSTSKVQFLGIG